MLHDNNLIEMSLRLNRSDSYSEQYENYPVLEEDLGQETTYDYNGHSIKFQDCTAKANTNFYIQRFFSNEFRFSFTN